MSKKRLYRVRLKGSDSITSVRLIEATSDAQAQKHVSDTVFDTDIPSTLEVAALVQAGCRVEVAGRPVKAAPALSDPQPACDLSNPAGQPAPYVPNMVGGGKPDFEMSPEVAERERAIRESPEVKAAIAAKEALMSTMLDLNKPMSRQAEEAFAERNAIGEIVRETAA